MRYQHFVSGLFETTVHFRVWFPEELVVVSPWMGVGADSADEVGYQTEVTLRPVNGWHKECSSRLPTFQRARVKALAIFSLGFQDVSPGA